MIKRFVAASATLASVVALAAPAFADTVANPNQATFEINGTVPAACNLSGMTKAAANTVFLGGASGVSIISSQTGLLSATSAINVALGANWCNGVNTTISITPQPLTTSAQAPNSSFTNRIDYTLTTNFPGVSGALDTSKNQVVDGAKIGAFDQTSTTATLTPEATSALLVAGTYEGSVTVTVTPTT